MANSPNIQPDSATGKQAELENVPHVVKTAKLSTSFNQKAKEAGETETVTIEYTFDVDMEKVFDHATNDLNIKVNTWMKKNAQNSADYLKFLADNGLKFSFLVSSFGEGRQYMANPLVAGKKAIVKMTKEQRAEMLATLLAMDDESSDD